VIDIEEVVTLTVLLAVETFPAASFALTVKEYVVEAVKPETAYVVEAVDPIKVAPWYTSYPVTPILSVAAVHDKLVEVEVVPEAANAVGAVGAVVSTTTAEVVTLIVLLAAEIFPAASFAFTEKEYVVEAVKPETA
jgi:hypothetical protein